MIKNEVKIDEELCHGCGYCAQFCPRGCIEMPSEQPGPMYSGFEIARFSKPEQCNACGICAWMCPCGAIEVFLTIKGSGKAVTRENIAGMPGLLSSAGFGDCVGCQKATVGRIVAEVLDELGLKGKYIGLDSVGCNSSTAFGRDYKITIEREDKSVTLQGSRTRGIRAVEVHEDPILLASELKRANPHKLVFVVQDTTKFDAIGVNPLLNGFMSGDSITVINCNEFIYLGEPEKGLLAPPASPVHSPDKRALLLGKNIMHLAEMAATFKGVSYSARSAITSPEDYERTKGYIRTAFQKQLNNGGTGFIDVLCACYSQAYESPWDTLKWIHDEVSEELPLIEFKNVEQVAGHA